MQGKIVSINVSEHKKMRKKPVESAVIKENFGVEGDAHASSEWHRQVSLLARESIEKMRQRGLDVSPGDFAENITTEGLALTSLPLGTRLRLGKDVIAEVSQIGKECHTKCAIFYQAGDCVMPTEGIFVKVMRGGTICVGDTVFVALRQPPDESLADA